MRKVFYWVEFRYCKRGYIWNVEREREWSRVRVYIDLRVDRNGLVGWLMVWKELDQRIGDKEVWGSGGQLDF